MAIGTVAIRRAGRDQSGSIRPVASLVDDRQRPEDLRGGLCDSDRLAVGALARPSPGIFPHPGGDRLLVCGRDGVGGPGRHRWDSYEGNPLPMVAGIVAGSQFDLGA